MEDVKLLEGKIRPIKEEDKKNLTKYSFSKIDQFLSCPYAYDLKYNKGQYPEQNAIYLDLGTLCHKILELKGRSIIDNNPQYTDIDALKVILEKGITEKTDKGLEEIIGLEDIKKKFGIEKYYEPDNASGMNYAEKIELFMNTVLPNAFNSDNYNVNNSEQNFEFVYNYKHNDIDKEIILSGFIDRVDKSDTGYKVIDYKTGKKIFRDADVKTSLQQGIYGLAVYNKLGVLPEEYEYNFIFLNQKQEANSKGYLKRLIAKLDKTFDKIDTAQETKEYNPSPCPLCYYCSYCENNPDASHPHNKMCEYYSLWTPDNKTFATNKAWNTDCKEQNNILTNETKSDTVVETPIKRKLIF